MKKTIIILSRRNLIMNHLIIFTIYAILMIAVMGAGLLISKNQWLAAIVKILIRIAEKYINADGRVKMNFVTKIVLYIYNIIFRKLKLAIPSEIEIQCYCQKIYDEISDQVNKIKALNVTTTSTEVNKIIKDITKGD